MSRIADAFLERNPRLLDDDRWSESTARWVARLTAPLDRYFRFRIRGFENVPDGACLLVGNHNAAAVQEILLLHRAWLRRFPGRPARGLMHRIAWQWPLSAVPLLHKLGGVYAHPRVAKRFLERGHTLLVFPGGDEAALRPFTERATIDFHGRSGFARLAREARVPIVPVAIAGSHAAYLLLPGGYRLATASRLVRLFGVKRFPLTLGSLFIAATLCGGPLTWPLAPLAFAAATLPLPTRIEMELLSPIEIGPDEPDDEVAERVRAAISRAVERMERERRTPWG